MSDRKAAKLIIAVAAIVQITIVLGMFAAVASADETQPAKPIRLPVIDSAEPEPVTPPSPKPVTTLPEDHFFVVESDVQLIVLHSPDGILTVDAETGPIRLRGRFAGSTGKVETKTFNGPFVYCIESKQAGNTELILIPSGVTSSDQIVRTMLSVRGSQPPPDDEKKPKPDPKPTPHSGKIHLDIIEDATNRTADTAICLKQIVGWSELIDAGNSYLIRDKDSAAGKVMEQDYQGNSLPVVIVRDKETKKVLRVFPLPEFETLKRLVKEVGG